MAASTKFQLVMNRAPVAYNNILRSFTLRTLSQQANKPPGTPDKQASPSKPVTESAAPNTEYMAKEFFEHNPMTYYDYEVEMSPSRLQQPSSLKK